MLRFLLLAASFLSAAPAYWTQKSVGPNPVAPFTLARTDTIIARQVHDTADSVRAYARARISDSMRVERAFDTVTARAVAHDTSLALRTLISAREPALGNPSQSGQVLSSTTGGVRSWISVVDSARTRAIIHDTSVAIRAATQPLDADLTAIAALTGTGYAKRTATTPTWTTVASIPDADIASAATWNAKLSTVTADATSRAARTFYAAPSGAAGTATFRAIVAADIPTLNQNTTGNAATATKWATARTLTIGATGKAVDGTGNVSWSLGEIGALASGGTAANSSALGGVGSDYFVQGNGAGAYGHRTTNLGSATTIPVTQSGFYDMQYATDGPQGAVWSHLIRSTYTGTTADANNKWHLDISAPLLGGNGSEAYYIRTVFGGSSPGTTGWRQLWHSGNLTSATLPGGPYLPLAGGTVTGYTNFTNDIGTQRQFVGDGDIFVRSGTVLLAAGDGNSWTTPAVYFPATSTDNMFRVAGGSRFDHNVSFEPTTGTAVYFKKPTSFSSTVSMVAGSESDNVAPAGYVYVTITTSGTTVLPTPSAGTILIVQRIGGTGSYYVKPPSGVTIAYTDLGGVARQMTNSATNGLNIGGASGVMMFVGGTSSTWGLIGAWPQGS